MGVEPGNTFIPNSNYLPRGNPGKSFGKTSRNSHTTGTFAKFTSSAEMSIT